MSIFGSVLQGVGSIIGGLAQGAAGKAQYLRLNMAAEQARREGAIKSAMILDQGRRQSADAIVAAAANGGGTAGSALDVLKDLERQISLSVTNTAISAENEGRNLNYQARVAKRQGLIGETTGFLNAGASFLDANSQFNAQGGQ